MSKPTILVREAWREGKRVRRRTRANLTGMPEHIVSGIDTPLRGGLAVRNLDEVFSIDRSLVHGHVAAVLGTMSELGMVRIPHRPAGRMRDLALAAVVARLLDPGSKLAYARSLSPQTASSSLGAVLDLGAVTGNEMPDMLDWLREQQPWIERSLANRHPKEGNTLVLHDVSSSCLEGQCCPLAAFGHNRDGRKGRKQITFGLPCAKGGCPVAVEVFAGNTGDSSTVASQVAKIRSRFGISRIALVGDRGMITTACIHADLKPSDLDWISAPKGSDIRKQLKPAGGKDGDAPLVPETLVPHAVAEIASPDFPGERLMVCLNPRLRVQRARKREELLQATEGILKKIQRVVRRPRSGLRGRDRINRRVGRDANRRKVERHFDITVTDDDITWTRDERRIAAEARLDGVYVIRTSLDAAVMGRCRGGGGVQGSGECRAGLPPDEDIPSRDPACPCLQRRACPGPCVPVHAGLPRGMEPSPEIGAASLRGRRP